MMDNTNTGNKLLKRPTWGKSGSLSRYMAWSERKLKLNRTELEKKQEEETQDTQDTGKKQVRIDEGWNQTVRIPARTEEEFELCFYQESDYSDFQKNRILTSIHYKARKKSSKSIDESSYCLRGLEDLCDFELKKRRQAEQATLKKRILEEQTRQKEAGCYPNWKLFREISLKTTKEARQRAINLGKEDSRENVVKVSSKRIVRKLHH